MRHNGFRVRGEKAGYPNNPTQRTSGKKVDFSLDSTNSAVSMPESFSASRPENPMFGGRGRIATFCANLPPQARV